MGNSDGWRGSERLGASLSVVVMHRAGPPCQPSVPESASQSPHLRPTDSKRGGGGAQEKSGFIPHVHVHRNESEGKEGQKSSVQCRGHQLFLYMSVALLLMKIINVIIKSSQQ